MLIRIGIPACFSSFGAVASELRAPILVSANAFYQHKRRRFINWRRNPFQNLDVALDSAGFVAMARYWGYPWNLDQYVEFARALAPTWWAAPDYCCEPEIAHDRDEVLARVERTAFKLHWAQLVATDLNCPPPMPVLQGWRPNDYLRCAEMMPELPALVGVGSVCRRPLSGPTGILAVVNRLERLPKHVQLHLFGVKGSAIRALAGHPRIHSVDSAAWDAASRRERKRDGETSNTVRYRSSHMRRWYQAQTDGLGLFGAH